MHLDDLIEEIRSEMEEMTDEERLQLTKDIMRGYCTKCGLATHGRVCECERDDRL